METKCSTCLGCNRLEDRKFKEVYRCKNYMRGREIEDGQNRNTIQASKFKSIYKRM